MKQGFWILSVLLWAGLASAGGLDPGLAAKLSGLGPNEELSVLVHLKAQADLTLFHPDNKAGMVAELHQVAEATQPALLARYAGRIRYVGPFWIYNGFVCTAKWDVIRDLAAQPEVDFVCENATVHLADYEETPGINTIEWNIRKIKADSVWRPRGYTGQGVVIGNIDTGVDVTHPALQSHWRSQDGWYDPVSHTATPHDSNGHGTFGMGIAVGSASIDTIGVALGASWIAAKAFSAGGGGQTVWLDSCFQWYAHLCSLGRGPAVIINAWGTSSRTDTHFWSACRNLQLLGVTIAFSVGALGPGSGTVPAPSNFPCLIGLGVTDVSDVISSFSSRGPAPTGYPWDSSAAWLDPQWGIRTPNHHIKPDLVAPGVNVRSSYTNHGYVVMSGTSWGPPHLAGAIALILQKNPTLTPTQLWQIITSTCDTFSWGNPYPNQNYGWGRLNCLRAVDATPSGVEAEASPSLQEALHLSVSPNPMRERCEFRLGSAQGAPHTVRLYDATGRLIRCLSGKGSFPWDGRNKGERPVASGVYFAVMDGRAGSGTRVVVTR
jgi:subtilisin family serine protease